MCTSFLTNCFFLDLFPYLHIHIYHSDYVSNFSSKVLNINKTFGVTINFILLVVFLGIFCILSD